MSKSFDYLSGVFSGTVNMFSTEFNCNKGFHVSKKEKLSYSGTSDSFHIRMVHDDLYMQEFLLTKQGEVKLNAKQCSWGNALA